MSTVPLHTQEQRIAALEAALLTETKRRQDAEAHAAALRDALNDLIVIGESEFVASDCGFCLGEGGWTHGDPPRMTPVRHKEGCVLMLAKSALASSPASCGDRLRKLEIVKEAAEDLLISGLGRDPDFVDGEKFNVLDTALSALDSTPEKE